MAAKAKKKASGKVRGDEENPTASVPGEEPVPSASTRARNAIPGTEIETASGPQEVGPTRGARRPGRGDEGRHGFPGAAPIVGNEAQIEALKDQTEKQVALRKAQEDPKLTSVVALRTGYYGHKRRKPGDLFGMVLVKGEPLPTWVRLADSDKREDESLANTDDKKLNPSRGTGDDVI